MKLYTQFITDVTNNKMPACKWVKLAVQRHLRDLQNKDFDYKFDAAEADRYIEFIQLFRLVEGNLAGQNFPLQPFQAFIIAMLFGWRHKKTKFRRYNDSYIQVPKKNAKSTLVAAIVCAMFFLEKEGLGQYLFAATSRGQANICFKISKLMIKKFIAEFDIQHMVSITVPSIEHNGNNSVISAASKEADSIEGKHASAASADEYHIHRNDDIVNNLKSGMGGRKQPLLLRITTPGTNLYSPCYNFYEYACSILEDRAQDEKLFTIMFSLDDGDDPWDKINWAKANPNIGTSPTWEFIEGQAKQAQNIGGYKMSDFLTKHMGIWVSNASQWIKNEHIDAVYRQEIDWTGKKGGFAGLDLAFSKDLTAFCICFNDNSYKWRFFIPESKLHSKEDGVDYTKWVDEGWITVTYGNDGNMTDYEVVKQVIAEDMAIYGIRKLYYDPWNANQLIIDLEKEGVKTGQYGQSPRNMTPVITALEEDILQRNLEFDNPVARWMFGNVKIKEVGSGLKKMVRDSTSNKIDGIVAMAMAKAAQMIEGKPKKKPQIILLNTQQNGTNQVTPG